MCEENVNAKIANQFIEILEENMYDIEDPDDLKEKINEVIDEYGG